jgi:ABC-type sugar transport system substrate-binding protein
LPVSARGLALAFLTTALLLAGAIPGVRPGPVAAAAPKVAILVGPTAITDSHYLPWARELRSTAQAAGATVDLRYCPTPAQAKNATAGANIIVYFGHGNGFPNPYSATEYPDTARTT